MSKFPALPESIIFVLGNFKFVYNNILNIELNELKIVFINLVGVYYQLMLRMAWTVIPGRPWFMS